jgi:hypothetical protein
MSQEHQKGRRIEGRAAAREATAPTSTSTPNMRAVGAANPPSSLPVLLSF